MLISVVIPTCNRRDSLFRLLSSLNDQESKPHEVIVVDSSSPPLELLSLQRAFPQLQIRLFLSHPSVCAQRNKGIQEANSRYVFLCDDDMEVPKDYIERLQRFLEQNPECGAVSGVVVEPGSDGTMNNGLFAISTGTLLKAFLLQLTVWTDVNAMRAAFPMSAPLWLLKRFYAMRANTFTIAGWPLLTQVTYPAVQTAIYGLGASIVRRDWLLSSPFDEHLDRHGIGDNYGVAIGFPSERPITVLTEIRVIHHKESGNRLRRVEAYEKRVLALHYFMSISGKFSLANRIMLYWSLAGQVFFHALLRETEMTRATFRTLMTLIRGRNPLLLRYDSTGLSDLAIPADGA